MIKERQIPINIRRMQALLRRLPTNHLKRQRISEDLAAKQKGYRGELSLDYYLKDIDRKFFALLPAIRLLNQNKDAFQMDLLLVSSSFLLIIEVKNISGTLYFDKASNQVIRQLHNKEQGFKNPITQVNRQRDQLARWLYINRFPAIPIRCLVVFSQPSTILKTSPDYKEVFHTVIHADRLMEKIHLFKGYYKTNILEMKEFKKLVKSILKEDKELQQDILNLYEIDKNEIIKGVECTFCGSFQTKREYGKWTCIDCGKSNKEGHIDALDDYFLLIGNTITNREWSKFLKIESRHVATYLLQNTNLQSSGTKKGTIYHSPYA